MNNKPKRLQSSLKAYCWKMETIQSHNPTIHYSLDSPRNIILIRKVVANISLLRRGLGHHLQNRTEMLKKRQRKEITVPSTIITSKRTQVRCLLQRTVLKRQDKDIQEPKGKEVVIHQCQAPLPNINQYLTIIMLSPTLHLIAFPSKTLVHPR